MASIVKCTIFAVFLLFLTSTTVMAAAVPFETNLVREKRQVTCRILRNDFLCYLHCVGDGKRGGACRGPTCSLPLTIKKKNDWPSGNETLAEVDFEIDQLIKEEKRRQCRTLELIASENFACRAILEAVGSCLTNKYSDGYSGLKFYGGTEMVDRIQDLCQKRALKAFDLSSDNWGVNVQPYSGNPANLAVFMGLLKPSDRIMGLDLPDGGHQSHGSSDASTSITSIFYQTLPYKLNSETHLIDYDMLEMSARAFRPQLIIAGTSTYSRLLDYKRFRQICDDVDAILLADMAHISGLVAANIIPSPFEYCDVVTTTTHKTLNGPKAGLIFYRKGPKTTHSTSITPIAYDYENKINKSVFPAFQGGAHIHSIAGVAVALKMAKRPAFRDYQLQVLKNSRYLANCLQNKGYQIVTDGTDSHMLVVDLRSKNIDGSSVEDICNLCSMAITRINCPGDNCDDPPSGIRLGTPALTSRQLIEKDFIKVANFLDMAIKIAIKVKNISKMVNESIHTNEDIVQMIHHLKFEVEEFLSDFPMPGFLEY
ncbi:Serine hydroxymethyltransferase 2 [Chamberlinius hualienensis]